MEVSKLLVVLGPTASGKTRLAVRLAAQFGGEIISADSRQVYKGMDIGTGKDLREYQYQGMEIPYHLIDIVPAGVHYNVYQYLRDFHKVYAQVKERGVLPILCGGSGLYLEAVCQGFDLPLVPEHPDLRMACEALSHEALIARLTALRALHNITDTQSRKRLIRAIEIAEWKRTHPEECTDYPKLDTYIIGIKPLLEQRRVRIDKRLEERLAGGMIEEAQRLMREGLTAEDMVYYGLEYKYLALYLSGALRFEEMKRQLNVAIHQFAKRQMTWFRGMERRGLEIHWVASPEELDFKSLHWNGVKI